MNMRNILGLMALLWSSVAFGASFDDRDVAPEIVRSIADFSVSNGASAEFSIPWGITGCTADPSLNPSYTASGLPGTLSLNSSTGVVTGTWPDDIELSITVGCTNDMGSITDTFVVTAGDPGSSAPTTPSTLNAIAFDNEFYVIKNTGKMVSTIFHNDAIEFGTTSTSTGWDQTRWKQWDIVPTAPYTIQNFTVTSLPSNGKVYDIDYATNVPTEITTVPTVIDDIDNLYYETELEHTGDVSFTVRANDTTGYSPDATLTVHVVEATALPMPYAVPEPTWGVGGARPFEESVPADPAGWPSTAATGYYYIDNRTGSGCNDSGNTYGTPDLPRCTFPGTTDIAAGGKFVVKGDHNNPYELPCFWLLTTGDSSSNPSWIIGDVRSPAKPVLTRPDGQSVSCDVRYDGSGLRVAGIISDSKDWATSWNGGYGPLGSDDSHVFMHSTIKNRAGASGSILAAATGGGSNFMLYNVHLEGSPNNNITGFQENDIHAVLGGGVDGAWMIDVTAYNVAGDAYQSNENEWSCVECRVIDHYLGRWFAHSFAENGINTKNVSGVQVFSELFMAFPSVVSWSNGSTSQGQIFLAGDDGWEQTGASLFINNKGWGSGGIILSLENSCDVDDPPSSGCSSNGLSQRAYAIGNRIGGFFPENSDPVGFSAAISSSLKVGDNAFLFNTVTHAEGAAFHENSFSNGDSVWAGNLAVDASFGFTARVFDDLTADDLLAYNAFETGAKYACCTGGSGSLLNTEYTSLSALETAYPSASTGMSETSDIVLTDAERLDMTSVSGSHIDLVPNSIWSEPVLVQMLVDFPVLSTIIDFNGTSYGSTPGGSMNAGADQ